MKWLIGATFASVIAASGAVVAGNLPSNDSEKAQAEAREALFTFMRAKPDEGEKVASICRVAFANPDVLGTTTSQQVVNTCRVAGISTSY